MGGQSGGLLRGVSAGTGGRGQGGPAGHLAGGTGGRLTRGLFAGLGRRLARGLSGGEVGGL